MTKNEYLKKLKRALRPVNSAERLKSLSYFGELIDDRIEEGVSEDEAVAGLESVDDAASRIISEAREQGQLRREHSVWEIILLVLGFPLWFPLLITVAIVIAVMYGLVWILIGVLFVVSASLAVSGVAGVFCMFAAADFTSAIAVLGTGLACAGIGVALFIPALYFATAYAKATPLMWQKLKFGKGGISAYE